MRLISRATLTVLSLLSLVATFSPAQGEKLLKKLTIDENNAFKIVVLSDLMLDDDATNFAYTMQTLQNVIDLENVPSADGQDQGVDLVVLLGNTVNPDFQDYYDTLFEQAVAYLKMIGIPWVSTGGFYRPSSVFTRDQLIQLDQASGDNGYNGENYTLSYTARNFPDSTLGSYTQRMPIYSADLKKEVLSLWIMDSQGGYSCDGSFAGKSCVNAAAVSWFNT